jgi:hypothetical protein
VHGTQRSDDDGLCPPKFCKMAGVIMKSHLDRGRLELGCILFVVIVSSDITNQYYQVIIISRHFTKCTRESIVVSVPAGLTQA